MKSIIKKILLEDRRLSYYEKIKRSNLGKFIRKHMDKRLKEEGSHRYIDPADVVSEVEEQLSIPYEVAMFLVFTYYVEERVEPLEKYDLDDWLYKTKDVMDFLKTSGYYDTIKHSEFYDLTKTDDGKMFFSVSGWDEFSIWFYSGDIAETVLGEDYADLFDTWHTDIDEVVSNLNDEGVKIVIEYIIENVDYIHELGHRDEFSEIMDEHGTIDVKQHQNDLRNIDSYNLNILVDEGSFDESDHIISALKSSYNFAYNLASEDEFFNSLKEEIEGFIGSEGEWVDGELVFDVTNRWREVLDKYLTIVRDIPEDSFLNLVERYMYNTQSLDIPDTHYFYPDSDKVSEYMSGELENYLY